MFWIFYNNITLEILRVTIIGGDLQNFATYLMFPSFSDKYVHLTTAFSPSAPASVIKSKVL